MSRALVFDWGGVIQRTHTWEPRHALDRELGLPAGSVERAVFESSVWELASTGGCSADEAWDAIVASLGWPEGRLSEFVERFFAGDRVDQDLVRLVRWLRARGVKVGLLSNAPPGRSSSQSASARWGMEGLFDAQVFSYQVGALKPDPHMYRAILEALDVSAREALFVDDAITNVQGALAVGMQAVHFCGVDALLRELVHHGLPTPAPEDLWG